MLTTVRIQENPLKLSNDNRQAIHFGHSKYFLHSSLFCTIFFIVNNINLLYAKY